MTQANEQDSWSELFIVSLQPQGGTVVDASADITTYDVTGGEKPFKGMANGAGGRIKQFEPQNEIDITLEGYTTDVHFYEMLHSIDTSEPKTVAADHIRTNYLLAIMHTTSTSITSAVDATAEGDRALRQSYKNGHIVDVKASFNDGICKFTIKYHVLPFAKNASSNCTYESTDGSGAATLPALTYP